MSFPLQTKIFYYKVLQLYLSPQRQIKVLYIFLFLQREKVWNIWLNLDSSEITSMQNLSLVIHLKYICTLYRYYLSPNHIFFCCQNTFLSFIRKIHFGQANSYYSIPRKYNFPEDTSAVTITTESQSLKSIICTRGQSTNQEDSWVHVQETKGEFLLKESELEEGFDVWMGHKAVRTWGR